MSETEALLAARSLVGRAILDRLRERASADLDAGSYKEPFALSAMEVLAVLAAIEDANWRELGGTG